MSTKLHITSIILLFQIWVVNAQITVPFSAIEKDYEIGTKQFFRANDTLQTYNIGKPGGENRWDFSGIQFSTETESEVLDPSTTAYASSYPEANRVTLVRTRTPIPTSSGTDLSLKNVYLYSRIDTDNNQVLSLGSVVEAPMSTQLGNIVSSFAPPIKNYPERITFGNIIISDGSSKLTISLNGSPLTVDGQFISKKEIDAYGTLILPNGKEVNALRIRDELTTFTILTPNGQSTFLYTFLMEDGSSIGIAPEENTTFIELEGNMMGTFSWVSSDGSVADGGNTGGDGTDGGNTGGDGTDGGNTGGDGMDGGNTGGDGTDGGNTGGDGMDGGNTGGDGTDGGNTGGDTTTTSIKYLPELELSLIYPNPFQSNAIVSYQVHETIQVKLVLKNLTGQAIKVIEKGQKVPGTYQNIIDGANLPAGIYQVVLQTPKGQLATKLVKRGG